MEPHKARHLLVILLLRASMRSAERMVPTRSWSHIVFLIGVSAALNTLWHIYVGCVLQFIVWATNFQHYFTFVDENFLCPMILNSYCLFLLVSIEVVMPMHFEELTYAIFGSNLIVEKRVGNNLQEVWNGNYEIKTTTKEIIDVHWLSLVYHVKYMISELLVVWYVSTGVLHGLDELVGRALHDLVQDAGCIFVPAQISSSARYLIFEFSRCPGA
jgi:hypothetical protein